jgi:hypothetical protein
VSTALFAVFVVVAFAGVALQVKSRGELRQFAIGSALVVASLPLFAAAWMTR